MANCLLYEIAKKIKKREISSLTTNIQILEFRNNGVKKVVNLKEIKKTLTTKTISPKDINSKYITFNNKTQNLSEWAKEYNILLSTLSEKIKRGMNFKEALNK